MLTKIEEFMIRELKIILGNPNEEYEEIKNDFLMQCEEYIEWFKASKKLNKSYDFENLIKILQSKMLLDEYEETSELINNFLKSKHSIKYIVYGNTIKSINDNQYHFVFPEDLIKLYNLNPKNCKIVKKEKDLLGFNIKKFNPMVIEPRVDGNYNIKDLEENYGRYN